VLSVLKSIKKVGEWSINGFKVIFVRGPPSDLGNIISLKEAVNQQLLDVSEVTPEGSVNALKVINKSEKFIIAFRGDILVGGKQNRTIFTTVIIAPKSENVIPVSCVEAGRWRWRTTKMRQRLKLPQLMRARNMMIEAEMPSRITLTERRVQHFIQRETWDNISSRITVLAAISDTEDVVEVMSKKVGEEEIPIPNDAQGIILIYDGKIVGGEIFFIPVDKSYLRESIISAYFDYLYYKKAISKVKLKIKSLEELMNELNTCKTEDKGSLFAEKVTLLKSNKVIGFLTSFEGKPIHLEFTALIGVQK